MHLWVQGIPSAGHPQCMVSPMQGIPSAWYHQCEAYPMQGKGLQESVSHQSMSMCAHAGHVRQQSAVCVRGASTA